MKYCLFRLQIFALGTVFGAVAFLFWWLLIGEPYGSGLKYGIRADNWESRQMMLTMTAVMFVLGLIMTIRELRKGWIESGRPEQK